MYKSLLHLVYEQPLAANDAGLRAADLLRSAGSLWDLCAMLSFVSFSLPEAGRLDEADEIVQELLPLADRIGQLGPLAFAQNVSAARDLMLTADIDKFEERNRDTLELCQSADIPWVFFSHRYLGQAHFLRGRWQQALEDFQEAHRLEIAGVHTGVGCAGLLMLRAYMGERDVTLDMLEQRRADLPRLGQPTATGAWQVLLAAVEGLATLGEREEAAAYYATVLEAIDSGAVLAGFSSRLLEAVAGIAAACGQQWELAEQHYQTALRQARELPHKIEQPEVRRWYARMLLDRDGAGDPSTGSGRDREKARELLTEAIAMYTKIGMPKHIEMAETMLGEV